MKKIFNKLFTLSVVVTMLVSACKKDRLLQDSYSPLDSFYNNNKQEEQEFIIDSTGSGPITGKMGTKIYAIGKSIFMHHDSSDITYPFTIKLVELYPAKDVILWNMPSVGGGNILEYAAEIRVRAFKDGEELLLKPGKKYTMCLAPMSNLSGTMKVYYGFPSGSITDWTISNDSLSSVNTDSTNFYTMNVAMMGWSSCAQLHNSGSSTTPITISAVGNNTDNIGVFIVFKNFKSVMQVYHFASGQVPVGEPVTLVAFAINQDGDYVLDKRDITLSAAQTITLSFTTTDEAGLLAALDAL